MRPHKLQLFQVVLLSFIVLACFHEQAYAKKKGGKASNSVSTSASPSTQVEIIEDKETASHKIVELDSENWNKTLDGSKAAVVMFYLSWCDHCKDMEPHFQRLAESASDQVIVGRVNLEKNIELAKRFRVDGAPTLLYFAERNTSTAQELLVRKAEAIASQVNRLANTTLFHLTDENLEMDMSQFVEATELQLKYVENISLNEVESVIAKRKTHLLILFVTNGSEPEFEQNNHLAAFDVVAGIHKEIRAGIPETTDVQMGFVNVQDEERWKGLGKKLGFSTKEYKSKVILFPQPEKGKKVQPIDCDDVRSKGCRTADAILSLLNEKANLGNIIINKADDLEADDLENDAG
ncbi:Thioredoxin domain-containing protein [Galdieria sulphuraria]|uniref:Protein disulfide isomerase n=1 Tax=Galdieria sulphuraria TaxID=130081 RepID=M2WA29_GALSU|nr:protein disulfide isomerase [Galdieria sulphuraria]EME32756.1 protein disulfide isomerase [Galdieria sulphuraria]GJD09198.1 Thioredoxin domain-containing protein [Galdieria sulphuraria]|eukprot:XP_005709276.1 protein disulfide isomerase [Galdieria sulphuraria]